MVTLKVPSHFSQSHAELIEIWRFYKSINEGLLLDESHKRKVIDVPRKNNVEEDRISHGTSL
jgi:hypothetical protein